MDTNNENLYYIWLTQIKGVGAITGRKLLSIFKSPEKIYELNMEELLQADGIGMERARQIIQSKDLTKAKAILKSCYDKNIKISNINDNIFPNILKKYDDSPILVYYKGYLNRELIGVAIVGSRRCSEYGKKVAVEAAGFLARNNVPVISGMAEGIDGYSHTACLNAGGVTVAILGYGVDICYPKAHDMLMKKIIENGTVISEYPPGTSPKPGYFLKRNRIICALASKVLIAESGEKSGALIAAEYAIKQEKELYVVSGNIFCREFKGSNKLISEGAKIYLNPKQLVDGIEVNTFIEIENKQVTSTNNALEEKIIEILKFESLTIDDIVSKIKIDKDEIIDILFMMEINNKVKAIRGKYVAN